MEADQPSPLTGANAMPLAAAASGGPSSDLQSGVEIRPAAASAAPVAPPVGDSPPSIPKAEPPSPLYGPYDVRAIRNPQAADPVAFAEEGNRPALPVAISHRDANLRLLDLTARSSDATQFRNEWKPFLRFVPLPDELEQQSASPIAKDRLDNERLNRDGRNKNPYAVQPIFDARCNFCSAKHCSRLVAGTQLPNCLKFREQVTFAPTRRICAYRRCLASHEHHTVVCPYLHRKCSRCSCRGHDTTDFCDIRNGAIMGRLRADFEEHANHGMYTRLRFEAIEWGFFPIPQVRPPGNFVAYERLTRLPVLEALALLQTLLLLPDNIAASVDHAPDEEKKKKE